jgi:pSer/pThr/pTyr-binding forkhead associated (FHA) protein
MPLHRPSAPEVSFAPRSPAQSTTAPLATHACPVCGGVNQRGLRFCVTCGHLLGPASSAPDAVSTPPVFAGTTDLTHTVPEPPPHFSSAPAAPAPRPPDLAPARGAELASRLASAPQRVCSRCRGVAEEGAQFCRFCGAFLASSPPVPLPPSPAAVDGPPPRAEAAPALARSAVAPTAPSPSSCDAVPFPALAPTGVSATARARLVVIGRDGREGPSYSLGESTDIGRSEGSILVADDRYISPRHARIAMRGGAFFVRDLESVNGVFFRIPFPRTSAPSRSPSQAGRASQTPESMADSEQLLADQDLFLVGQQVLRFEVVKHADEGFGVASENGTLLFGTPAAPRHARLSQRTVEGVVRDVFHVKKAETVIGRESGDIVFSDDAFLSRRHAMVRAHGASSPGGSRSFSLTDLGSSNGTFLQVREEVRLRHGDHFRIGQQLFRFDT